MEVKQTPSLGIKETKEMVLFIGAVGTAFAKAKEDGKITIDDAMLLIPLLGLAKDAFHGAEKIIAELKDLDKDEKKELIDEFSAAFSVNDDLVEHRVVLALEIGLKLIKLINSF